MCGEEVATRERVCVVIIGILVWDSVGMHARKKEETSQQHQKEEKRRQHSTEGSTHERETATATSDRARNQKEHSQSKTEGRNA